MNRIRNILIALRVLPKEESHPTQDERLRAEIARRAREMEARLRMIDAEARVMGRQK